MMPLGLSLVCAMSAATTHDDLLQATLTVDNGAVPKPILNPGELFGSFFEDFLHAGEGGVYAEMLSNKALALPLANTSSFSNHVCQCNVFLVAKNNTCRHNALPAAVANIRMTTNVVHPMLTALETTCVSILMYSKVADRILEHSDLKYCAFLL